MKPLQGNKLSAKKQPTQPFGVNQVRVQAQRHRDYVQKKHSHYIEKKQLQSSDG